METMKRIVKSNMMLVMLMCLLLKGQLLFSQTSLGGGVAIPPSPQAQSFELLGKYPVSTYTGLADINFPILQRKVDGFDLNIALRYHPSGIKVNQTSSWVGLGWNISGIGTITRIINGGKDEEYYGILGRRQYYPATLEDLNHYELTTDKAHPDFQFFCDLRQGKADSESDFYYLNVGDISCQFIVRPDGKCETLPQTNIVIEHDYQNGFKAWRVKDELGNIFLFSQTEESASVETETYTSTSSGTPEVSVFPTHGVSAWYLTKVITRNGQEILFGYQTGGRSISYSASESLCYYPGGFQKGYPYEVIHNRTKEKILYLIPVLREIAFPGGNLTFEMGSYRLDQEIQSYPLSRIKHIGQNSTLLLEYRFGYSYFQSDETAFPISKRLRLDELVMVGKDLEQKKYSFEYYEDMKLPWLNSLAQDYWGYYNGQVSNSDMEFDLIPDEAFSEVNKPYHRFSGAQRKPSFPEMRAWTLKSIRYPTGGHTDFTYAPHDWYKAAAGGGTTEMLGGLRISRIVNYTSPSDTKPYFTEYRYTRNGVSSSSYRNVAKYNFSTGSIGVPYGGISADAVGVGFGLSYDAINEMHAFYSQSLNGLGETKGAATGYRRIEVWQGQMLNGVNTFTGGHEVYTYFPPTSDEYVRKLPFSGIMYWRSYNPNNLTPNLTYCKGKSLWLGSLYFPFFSKTYKDWADGLLESVENYSEKNILVKRTENLYTSGNNQKVVGEGLRVAQNPFFMSKNFGINPSDPMEFTKEYTTLLDNNHYFTKYEIVSDWVSLDYARISEFYDGKELKKTTQYYYDPIYHKINKSVELFPSKEKTTTFSYPFDYHTAVCDTMVKRNILPLVEKRSMVNGVYTEGEKFDYELGRFNAKLNRNLINLSVNYSWAANQWDKKNTFTYNTEGDVVEVNSKGLISAYLWGSNKDCPVASAIGIGADFLNSQFKKAGYENRIDTLVKRIGNLETESQRTLYAQFNRDLRAGLGKEVQVETYTYEPLWGLTSKTDSRGRTTRYEYDGFSRLSAARDNEEKYVGQFGYWYYDDTRPEVYTNTAKSRTFTKNSCAAGGVGSSVTYTVAAGAYTSIVSQADADAKAQNDVNTNGQAYANSNGTCTFSNVAKSGTYTKNSCAAGGVGSSVTYTVPAGKYTSTISQADADAKAQNDVNTNGQVYANSNAICYFLNLGNLTLNFTSEGYTQTETVTSNTTYSITSNTPWIMVSQGMLSGNGSVGITCSLNVGGTRSGSVTIQSTPANGSIAKTITISQAGSSFISTTQLNFEWLGGNQLVTLGGDWSIASISGSFITATKVDRQTLKVQCTKSMGARNGSITLRMGTQNVAIYVTQAGNSDLEL